MQLFNPKVLESLGQEQIPQLCPGCTTSETAVVFLSTIERDAVGVKIDLPGTPITHGGTEVCLLVFCVFRIPDTE